MTASGSWKKGCDWNRFEEREREIYIYIHMYIYTFKVSSVVLDIAIDLGADLLARYGDPSHAAAAVRNLNGCAVGTYQG